MKIAIIGPGYVGQPELMRTEDQGVSYKVSKCGTDPFLMSREEHQQLQDQTRQTFAPPRV